MIDLSVQPRQETLLTLTSFQKVSEAVIILFCRMRERRTDSKIKLLGKH